MLSVAKVQRRNAWRYYVRGVAYGDGCRPVGQSLKAAQEKAGLPPGRWWGRGVTALGLAEGAEVSERQLELLFGQGRHPDADRIEQRLLDDGVGPAAVRRATVLGQPIEEIEARNQTPLLALDFTFRPQASLTVMWALGDARTRRVIERAHERAVTQALRWLEDDVAETRWSSGRGRAKTPVLVVAAFRHFDNRHGFPLLHEHCLVLNRVQRRGADGEPRWGALDTTRLYKHVVAAGTLCTLAMTTEVCEELGLATVPREVTPGLRPVMEIAGVDQVLIDWSSTRRQRIEDALEGLTYTYVQEHGRLPGEKARHGLGWQAAQDTRPEKKTPRPLEQLLARWRASAVLAFGKQIVDGLVHRCRAVGAALRARVDPVVDTALAAVDHPGRDAARTPAQWAADVPAHQQAAMPDVYLEGRTTDPATWLRTPENLDRLAAFTREANARRHAIANGRTPAADPGPPVDRHSQEHEEQRQPGQDPGHGFQP
ncbi:MobF family relaxase [Streptomyces rhizosphaericola]|uniref:MobF family relaxase n=1 Tax=Streptomyces rhizosphaericola TaxID=2564098 RepID=UPI0039F02409